MGKFIIRILISAIAVAVAAWLLPGITLRDDSLGTLLLVGLCIGLVNAILKPLVVFLTCPAVLLSLGLFIFVINGLMLQAAAWLAGDALRIDGFGTALLGGIIVSIVNMILEGVTGVRDERKGRVRVERSIPRRGDF